MKKFLSQYKHAWVFLYFIFYLPWYFGLQLRGDSGFHDVYTMIDQATPFITWFIYPYVYWFLFVAGTIAYLFFRHKMCIRDRYGYGCVLLYGQNVIEQFNGKGHSEDYVTMRNVAGEIIGSEMAIRYAIKHGYQFICIYYDYEGIEKWANGLWKANKIGTQAYQRFIEESRKSIDISFVKVLAHSGDVYNDVADALAKKAVGIS